MKTFWMAVVLTSSFAVTAIAAQQESSEAAEPLAPPPIPAQASPEEDAPIPPKITSEEPEPTVRISEREGERVEEYSRNGRVYMVKITPEKGLPYYYIDEDGDGELEIQSSDGQGGVRPVYWKVKEW